MQILYKVPKSYGTLQPSPINKGVQDDSNGNCRTKR